MPAQSVDHLTLAIMRALPYADQVTDLDTRGESDAIRFSWRGSQYRVSMNALAEEVDGNVLRSNNATILMSALLKRQLQNANVHN